MPTSQLKPFDIPKQLVWEAYRRVAANNGAPGMDEQTLVEFESDLKNNLYRIWNRMSSGSYFPPPVRAVEIPKPHGGGVRVLGVPTVADRVTQTVVAMELEEAAEPRFHPDSYGYRPRRFALDAVGSCRKRCWKFDWVIDLDIQAFLRRALEPHGKGGPGGNRKPVGAALRAPVVAGALAAPRRNRCRAGTGNSPGVGGLADLRQLVHALRVRPVHGEELFRCALRAYADDAVVHCVSKRQAERVLAALAK